MVEGLYALASASRGDAGLVSSGRISRKEQRGGMLFPVLRAWLVSHPIFFAKTIENDKQENPTVAPILSFFALKKRNPVFCRRF